MDVPRDLLIKQTHMTWAVINEPHPFSPLLHCAIFEISLQKMAALTVFLVLCALCGCTLGEYSDLKACKYTDDNGKTYDLSPLSKG
ncbi:MAG: hypothetical protein MJE68_21435 [Proteobacteria bacterium]|nr:hypothetical protein [Pseudomonadota bacterium]